MGERDFKIKQEISCVWHNRFVVSRRGNAVIARVTSSTCLEDSAVTPCFLAKNIRSGLPDRSCVHVSSHMASRLVKHQFKRALHGFSAVSGRRPLPSTTCLTYVNRICMSFAGAPPPAGSRAGPPRSLLPCKGLAGQEIDVWNQTENDMTL